MANFFTTPKTKNFVIVFWIIVILVAFYLYFFGNNFFQSNLLKLSSSSLLVACLVYFLLGCLRGFSLIPVTYLIILGILFLPPLPLFLLTIAGIMVSSICTYYFSELLHLNDFFESRYKKQIDKLKVVLQKHELPIIILWSSFPFAPTDVICYVCGALEIDVGKFLLGILIGEGVTCAAYIFLGKGLLVLLSRLF